MTTNKEHPILFSGPMVKAILEGRKTQTRRVIKPQPTQQLVDCDEKGWYYQIPEVSDLPGMGTLTYMSRAGYTKFPYGHIGDRLWVRETWAKVYDLGDGSFSVLPPTCKKTQEAMRKIIYRADSYPNNLAATWHPSIHMFRKDSRITLEITGIRVERLNEFSYDDARAEGLESVAQLGILRASGWKDYTGQTLGFMNIADSYRTLWDSINGKRVGCTWNDNPFVWAISFKQVAQ